MDALDHMEKETIAEVGNISLGAAASALSTIIDRRVDITTPQLEVCLASQVEKSYPLPCLLAEVKYLSGLQGNNVLLIKQEDAVVIAGLMMGVPPGQLVLGEMELSAIQEAMNQMMGYMATAMSEMFGMVLEISPPVLTVCDLSEDSLVSFDDNSTVVQITFSIRVDDVIDSKLIQVIPLDFAKKMAGFLLSGGEIAMEESPSKTPVPEEDALLQQAAPSGEEAERSYPPILHEAETVPAYSESDNDSWRKLELVREIPLEVTVILGKRRLPLGELFLLNRGSILALDQPAGNPVEILINKKRVARGEVVLIDEQFGVRITEYLSGFKLPSIVDD
ncbi:MAG: flagellar motor switch phosphatase FliY [Firmicutes bacterium]|nr:flagellar motor switch phosphatase FliY [Bacillota bacterium]